MKLMASLMSENRFDEELADVDVHTEVCEPFGHERMKRKISGTVIRRGPIWDDFFGIWTRLNVSPHEEGGIKYVTVNGITVEHDYYAFFQMVGTDGHRIGLILTESWTEEDGDVEQYKRVVRERNAKLALQESNVMTRNDIRERLGLNPKPGEFFNTPLPADLVAEFRKTPESRLKARNTIV